MSIFHKIEKRILKMVLGGAELLILIRQRKSDEIYLILSNPLGDCVYGLAYADSLRRDKQKQMTIFTNSKWKSLVENYRLDAHCVYLAGDSKEWTHMQLINSCKWYVLLGKRFGVYNVVPWIVYPFHKYDSVDCLSLIRDKMFELSTAPTLQHPDFSQHEITCIENFDKFKDRIVVINPYSGSMNKFDTTFFSEISRRLQDKGYTVYTNVVGNQNVIEDTLRLECSIEEMYAICNKIPLVVSVRSGIIDFCISAKTKFFVLYFLDKFKGNGKGFYGQYTLLPWDTGNVKEEIYHDKTTALASFDKYVNDLQIFNISIRS